MTIETETIEAKGLSGKGSRGYGPTQCYVFRWMQTTWVELWHGKVRCAELAQLNGDTAAVTAMCHELWPGAVIDTLDGVEAERAGWAAMEDRIER